MSSQYHHIGNAVPMASPFVWFTQIMILSSITLLSKILYSVIYNLHFHPLRIFPGPTVAAATPIPFVWRMLNGRTVHWTTSLHEEYGEVVRIHLDELSFVGASAWRDIYACQPELPKPVLGTLVAANGVRPLPTTLNTDDHNWQRRILSHAFSDCALKEQEYLLHKYSNLFLSRLQDKVREGVRTIDIYSWSYFTIFDILGDLCFGESFHCLEATANHEWITAVYTSVNMGKMMTAFQHFPPLDFIIKSCVPDFVRKKMRKIFDFSRHKIDKRMKRLTDRPDFMSYILKNNHKAGMSQDEIDATVTVLVLAGSGATTTTVMSAVTYFALRTPGVMARLQQEIQDATYNDPNNITAASVSSLPFLHAVILEAMRLRPAVTIGNPREVNRPGVAICGVSVPQGCRVSVPAKTAYRLSSKYADATSFLPQRSLPDAPPRYSADEKEVFEPFMVGPRNCLGKALAWTQMKLILSKIFLTFNLQLSEEPNVEGWGDQKDFFVPEAKPLSVTLGLRCSMLVLEANGNPMDG